MEMGRDFCNSFLESLEPNIHFHTKYIFDFAARDINSLLRFQSRVNRIIFNDVSADKSYFRFQNVECTRNESKRRDISCTKGILNRVDVDNSDLRRLVRIALKSCDCEPTQFARRKKSWKEDGGRYASYLLTKWRN